MRVFSATAVSTRAAFLYFTQIFHKFPSFAWKKWPVQFSDFFFRKGLLCRPGFAAPGEEERHDLLGEAGKSNLED